MDIVVSTITSDDGIEAERVELIGDLDAHALGDFEDLLDKFLVEGLKNVIVDCAKMKYINSGGLSAFLNYTVFFKERGGGLALTYVPDNALTIMEMIGFTTHFKILPDNEAALSWFKNPDSEE